MRLSTTFATQQIKDLFITLSHDKKNRTRNIDVMMNAKALYRELFGDDFYKVHRIFYSLYDDLFLTLDNLEFYLMSEQTQGFIFEAIDEPDLPRLVYDFFKTIRLPCDTGNTRDHIGHAPVKKEPLSFEVILYDMVSYFPKHVIRDSCLRFKFNYLLRVLCDYYECETIFYNDQLFDLLCKEIGIYKVLLNIHSDCNVAQANCLPRFSFPDKEVCIYDINGPHQIVIFDNNVAQGDEYIVELPNDFDEEIERDGVLNTYERYGRGIPTRDTARWCRLVQGDDTCCAQSDDVTDFNNNIGYIEKVKRTINHTYNIAQKVDIAVTTQYNAVKGFADTISDGITRAFSKDVLCSEASAQIFELVMDMTADYKYKLQVPIPRWISYISRILRLFGLNSLELAYNFVFSMKDYFDFVNNKAQAAHFQHEVIITLIGLIITSVMPSKDSVRKVTDLARFYGAVVTPVSDFVSIIRSWIEYLPQCAQAWFNYLCPDTFWRDALMEDAPASKWISATTKFVEEENMMSIQYDNAKIHLMHKLHDEGHFIQKQFALCKDVPSSIQILISKNMEKLDAIVLAFDSHEKNQAIRPTPYCICLYGASQVGKSTLGNVISRYLFPTVPIGKLRYVRKISDDFWSGYVGQPVVCYDDFSQNAEMLDAIELFDQISNAPCPLNMPSLNDPTIGIKGTMQRSKLFVLCTNTPFPDVRKVVTCEEAFHKRRHLLINVEARPEFVVEKKATITVDKTRNRKGMYIDIPKVEKEISVSKTIKYMPDYSHLKFTLMSSTEPGVVIKEFDTPKQLFQFIKSGYDNHMELQEEMMKTEDNFIANYLSEVLETDSNKAEGLIDTVGNTAMIGLSTALLTQEVIRIKEAFMNTNRENRRAIMLIDGLKAMTNVFLIYKGLANLFADAPVNEAEGKYARKDVKIRKPKVYAQSTTDPNAAQIANDVIGSRMCYMSARWNEATERSMCALPIGGTLVLTPYHLFMDEDGKEIPENSKLTLVHNGVTFIAYFQKKHLKRLKNNDGTYKDAAVYRFGPTLRPFKRIDHLFIKEKDLSSIYNVEALLLKYNKGVSERELVKVNPLLKKEYYSLKDEVLTLNSGWIYQAVTQGGDCGSPLVMFNTKLTRKILGIHVSARAQSHRAYGETVCEEHLHQIKDWFDSEVLSFQHDYEYDDDAECDIELQGNLSYLGNFPRNKCAFQHRSTDIMPSMIHEKCFAITTLPAVLSKNDKRMDVQVDPLEKAVNKYSDSALPFEPEVLDEIGDHLNTIMDNFKGIRLGDIGEDVAINGDSTVKFMEPLNMHTATGYPYNLIKADKSEGGKKWLFSIEDEEYYVSHPMLRQRLDERYELAKKGFRYDSISIANLKDERRPIEKIRSGKTRHFSLFPTDYVILCKRFMQEFIASFYQNHLDCFVAVGMDPYSVDSNVLIENLEKVSDIGFDGDFGTFDGKIPACIIAKVLDHMDHFYKSEIDHDERMRVRTVLVNEMIHTIELAGNVLYAKHNGDPSGCPITTLMNCIVNYYYMAYCYLRNVPVAYRSMKHFDELVRLYVFGDDNIVAVDRAVVKDYNLITVSETLARHGIEYKPNDDNWRPFKPIMELTFLKNSFRRDGRIVKACLDRGVIQEMTNWIRNCEDPYVATLDNCNTSLRYAYFHGREYFTQLRCKYYDALMEVFPKPFNLYTYNYLDRVFVEEGSFSSIEELEVEMNVAQADSGLEENTEKTDGHVKALGEQVGITGRQENINFVEQSGVLVSSTKPYAGKALGEVAAEEVWTAARILGRPMKIGTVQWTTAQASGTNLASFYPMSKAYTNQIFLNILDCFMYFRGTCVIRIEVNGIRFNSGRLIGWYTPMTNKNVSATWHVLNKCAQTSINHVFLDACDNSVVELEMPFYYTSSHYKSFQTAEDTDGNAAVEPWDFYLQVFNQMRAATGASTAINVSVFMYFKDIDLKVPVPANRTAVTLTGRMQQGSPVPQSDLGVNINLKGWDKIINSFLPKNIFKDALDVVQGRDHPNDTINPVVMVRKPCGYPSNSRNVEHIQRLAFDPSLQIEPLPDHFGTTQDEMDIKFLTSKYSWLTTQTLTTSGTANSFIWESEINPCMSSLNSQSGLNLTTGSRQAIPLLSCVSLPFSYWRGSLKVKLDVVATSFHTAKLGFYIQYGYNNILSTATTLDPSTTYTTIFELNGDKKCFEFEVPYITDTPWKRVLNYQFVQPGTNQASIARCHGYITGQMGFYIVHPLVAPSNVSTSIDLNIFVGGGDDFELAYIGTNNIGWNPTRNFTPIAPPATAYSEFGTNCTEIYSGGENDADAASGPTTPTYLCSDMDAEVASAFSFPSTNLPTTEYNYAQSDDNIAQSMDCSMVGPSATYKKMQTGHDVVRNLKDVMKRYHIVGMEHWKAASGGYNGSKKYNEYIVSNLLNGYNYESGQNYPRYFPSGLSYWTAMFRSYVGGLRFKRLIHTEKVNSTTPAPSATSAYPRYMLAWTPDLKSIGELFTNPGAPAGPAGLSYNAWCFMQDKQPNSDIPIGPCYRGAYDPTDVQSSLNEVEIPWEHNYVSTLTHVDSRFEFGALFGGGRPGWYTGHSCQSWHGLIMSVMEEANTNDLDHVMLMSVADDFRMGGFLGAPYMSYNGYYNGATSQCFLTDGWSVVRT